MRYFSFVFFYFFARTKTIYKPSYRFFLKFIHLKGLKGILKIDLYLGPRFEDEILIKLLRWRHEVWTWNFALRSASLWVSWCEFPYCYTFLREKQVNSLITVFFNRTAETTLGLNIYRSWSLNAVNCHEPSREIARIFVLHQND